MALIKCPECSTEVSDKAETCLKCGFPIETLVTCPECGAQATASEITCAKCGCPLKEMHAIPAVAPVVSPVSHTVAPSPAVYQSSYSVLDESDEFDERGELPSKQMWVFAVVFPLVLVLEELILGSTSSGSIAGGIAVLFCALDSRWLKKCGWIPETSKWWLWFLAPPIYIFVRAAKTDKKYGYAITFCVLCVVCAIIAGVVGDGAALQEKSSSVLDFNGSWKYEESGQNEALGRYEFHSILAIKGENYLLFQDRTSGLAMHWDHCQIGRIVITGNEIELHPEATRGQMARWHSTQEKSRYKYTLKGQSLTLTENGNTEIYKKTDLREQLLLIYTGTMSGTRTLTIKLVIGRIDSDGDVSESYYMYLRNEKYGEPIELTGSLKNGILLLTESDEKFNNVASMRFPNFNPNSNNITGVWQDLRTGRSGIRYDIELSIAGGS